MRHVARIATAALGLTLLGLCAACSSTVRGHATASAEELARPPQTGDCWQLNAKDVGSPLDQPARRSCTQPHNSETVFVSPVSAPADEPYPTEAQLRHNNPVGTAVFGLCSEGAVLAYLGDDGSRVLDVIYVDYSPRLPSRQEWNAGARWVRCDVVYGDGEPRPAPGRMANALNGPQAAAYHECLSGTWQSHEVVPCSAPHEAEIIPDGTDVSDVPNATDTAARQAFAQRNCANALDRALYFEPRPSNLQLDVWLDPDETGEDPPIATCVLVSADGGRTTTIGLP